MPSHIPDGYNAVTPYLNVHDAAAAIDFYRRAFGAEEQLRLDGPDGKIAHAEIRIGGSTVMLADENPEWGNTSPRTLKGTTAGLMLYVEDADAAVAKAADEGANVMMPVADQFWGDRMGQIEDPFGHRWSIASQKETLSEEEIDRRWAEWKTQQQAA